MGEVKVTIKVGNAHARDFREVEAIVDTETTITRIPATLLTELGVPVERTLQSELADGSTTPVGMGRTWIRVAGQEIYTPVLFAPEGEPALLGTLSMAEAFLIVDPVSKRVVPAERIRR